MKNIKLLIVLALVIGLSTPALAKLSYYDTNYTPERPSIDISLNPDGSSNTNGKNYPSFNSFTNNPNIGGAYKEDEKVFTLIKYCEDGTCLTDYDYEEHPEAFFYNNLNTQEFFDKNDLKEGDVLKFQIYFHNNGKDGYENSYPDKSDHPEMYDSEGKPITDAKNVKIGIDIGNLAPLASEPDDYIRPKGFIYANNNKYTEQFYTGDPLEYKLNDYSYEGADIGDIVRTAADDVLAALPEDLAIETTDDMGMYILPKDCGVVEEPEGTFSDCGFFMPSRHWDLNETMTIGLKNHNEDVPGEKAYFHATPKKSESKMWIEFDRFPGCFRFSGLAYFEVKLVKKETPPLYCKTIYVNHNKFLYKDTVSTFQAKAFDNEGNVYKGQHKYSVDAGYGKFYLSKPSGFPDNSSPMVYEIPGTDPGDYPMEELDPDFIMSSVLTALTLGDPVEIDPDAMETVTGVTTLTVNAGTKVYFVASQDSAGEEVVHVEALKLTADGGTTKMAEAGFSTSEYGKADLLAATPIAPVDGPMEFAKLCAKDYPTTETAEVCKEIVVKDALGTDPEPIYSNTTRVLQAKAFATDGTLFGTKIHYKIKQPNHGFFYYFAPGFSVGKDILVNQNQKVFVVTNQPAVDAILVEAPSTTVKKCARLMDIVEEQVCKEIKVTDLLGTDPEPIYESTTRILQASSTDQSGNPFNGDINYSINPANGQFYSFLPYQAGNSITVPQNKNVYLMAQSAGTDVITVDTLNTNVEKCTDKLSITKGLQCSDISVFISDIMSPLPVGVTELKPAKIYRILSDVTYSPTLPVGLVTYSTPGYGAFVPEALYNTDPTYFNTNTAEQILAAYPYLAGPMTLGESVPVYFITKTNIPASITDALTVKATGSDVKECSKSYDLVVENLPCQNITVNYSPQPFNPEQTTTLQVTGTLGDFAGVFRFSAPHGSFRKVGESGSGGNPRDFSIADAAAGVEFVNGQSGDSITINAVGELSGTNCNFVLAPGLGPKCVDLSIAIPEGVWTVDDFTDDDEQMVQLEVTTLPAGYASNFKYNWTVSSNEAGEWSDGTSTDSLVNYLLDIVTSELDYIEVWATDKLTGENFYDAEGNQICSDKKIFHTPDSEEPVIQKAVYDSDPDNDKMWRALINISGKDEDGDWAEDNYAYITYRAAFEPGSAASAALWEENMDNGKIESENLDGDFEYRGMAIAVSSDIDGEEVNYLAYSSFEDKDDLEEFVDYFDDADIDGEDTGEDSLLDYIDYEEMAEDVLEYDDDDVDDVEDYEDLYSCDSDLHDSRTICMNNFDDIEDDFKDGKGIQLNDLHQTDKIYLIYQFDNNTVIDDEECKDLEADEGCGERFDNVINYLAWEKELNEDDWDDVEYDEDYDADWQEQDDARVIVICPFILARESGDVFFYDAIDTGVDVKYCSEVENAPLVITPDEEEENLPSTGPGESEGSLVLVRKDHDVCKLSDTDSADLPYEYRDALKNFSSSVCEMRAEVAAEWTKEVITDSINKNISALSRWTKTTSDTTLANMDSVAALKGSSQGVVVIENADLTIDGGSTGFKIAGTSNVPAAQTYIVKGGNLHIKSNIAYDDSNADPSNPKSLPSAAFVVMGGNILIDNDVTKIDGILMAVDGEIKSSEGQVTKNRLLIRGSLIGNIVDLFKNRRGVGDPMSDEGSVTVRYDERIILNPPTGLKELVDVSQLRVAN